MLSCCLKCKKGCKKPKGCKHKKERIILSLKFAACNSKKLSFNKEQEARKLLSNPGLKTSLSKVPILGDILF